MIYLKSTIAGMAALLLTAVTIYIVALVTIAVIFRPDGNFTSWHVHTESPAFWVLVTVIFALGFFWEFRRLSN